MQKNGKNQKISVMNNLKRTVNTILFLVLLLPLSSFTQDRHIPESEIPSTIRSYIKTHFPNHTILKTEVDKGGKSKEYEIRLNDRTELVFNSKFQIKKIDGKTSLPQSVIPTKISEYVKTRYPDKVITGWEMKWKHQEIELDSGVELEFSVEGDFLRVD